MNPQYENHINRFTPAGFLGLGKGMAPCSAGRYVLHSDYEREQMRAKGVSSALEAVRLRERQLESRIKQLEADLKLSEKANLDLIETVQAVRDGSSQRDENLAKFVEVADLLAKNVTKKSKLKSALEEYERLRDAI